MKNVSLSLLKSFRFHSVGISTTSFFLKKRAGPEGGVLTTVTFRPSSSARSVSSFAKYAWGSTVRTVGCQPNSERYFTNLSVRWTPLSPIGGK